MVHYNNTCPARGRRCLKCNRFNHFSRTCRVYEVDSYEQSDQVIYLVNKNCQDWSIAFDINGHCILFKIDTGADVNVLPRSYLKDIGVLESDLIDSSVRLRGYSGSDIKVVGMCHLKIKHKGQEYITEFTIADVSSPPILGLNTCRELNLVQLVLAVGTEKEDNEKQKILKEFSDIFDGVGCMPGEHRIQINTNINPVVHAPRKLPEPLKNDIKCKLDEMTMQGIISKVEGPTDWVNSMTVVRKPNGDLRLCLDPKDLNKAIKREYFPLPTLDEITAKLGGSKFFSTVDAKQGFWQLKLAKDCTDLLTFNTAFGRYKFLRLPYGITSASEVFHKKMYEHFDDIEGVCLFVDDLLIYGKTKQEHDERLKKVLQRCREINLKLNQKKCKFCLTEITYLGHKITQKGIYPDPTRTSAILNMPRPQNVKDVERFLGLITYVGRFIPNLSDKSHKLRELLKKDTEWHWSNVHEETFKNLKSLLSKAPVLQYYSLEKPVVISVDSSKDGLGACILQNGLPVTYASRTLTNAERNYAQIEKELLACVFACERFYPYIYGRSDVTIETDHKPLVSIISKPIGSAPARLQRMLLRLQLYTFNLVYTPGKYLFIADTLSRATQPPELVYSGRGSAMLSADDSCHHFDAQAQVCVISASNPLTDTHFVKIQKETATDTELQILLRFIKAGWPDHKQDVPLEIRSYWSYRDELTFAYGLIWKGQRIVVPKSMRSDFLQKIHLGHQGIDKCKLKTRESMFII